MGESHVILLEKGRLEICPHTSFIQNIGRHDGWTHTICCLLLRWTHRCSNPDQRVDDFDTDFVDDWLDEITE